MQLNIPLVEYRKLLGTYLGPQRGRVALLVVLLLGSIGLQLLNPQVIRYFIDATQARGATDTLLLAGIAFIAIGLGQRAIALATTYMSINVGWSATNALRANLTHHLLRLDMPFHKTHTPGELIERVDGDVTLLANFFSRFAIRIASNALLVAGILALLYAEDWRAGLGLTIYTLITLAILASLQNLGTRRWTAARQASAEQFGYIEERISGTEDIRGSGAEANVLARLFPLMRKYLKTDRSANMVGTLGSGLTDFLFVTGYALGLGFGAYLYTQGDITIGTAFLIVYYIGMLADPLRNIRDEARDLQQSTASINRVSELFARQPKVREATRATLPSGPLSVTFDAVSFAYDDGPVGNGSREPGAGSRQPSNGQRATGNELQATGDPSLVTEPSELGTRNSELGTNEGTDYVLRDISFALRPGRVLGVLGRTGSGKTTITRLLFRLYDPTRGTIRLGDVDIRDVTLDDLRGRVGMVTQDVQLFRASLRDNIAFFDPAVSDERITEALRALGLWDWVRAMPDGLQTLLASGGAGMSAGEAQLLAFTRLLLKDPGLVILDEAASRLDPITEQRLELAITRVLQDRTAIIIAHRLRTVQRADDILILERGRVVEYGPRERLATDPTSRFYSLLQTGLEEALA